MKTPKVLRQATALASAVYQCATAASASHLFVEVRELGEVKVSVKMPATVVENLADLVPQNVLMKLEQEGKSLGEICERVKQSNFAAQTVFEASYDLKHIRIWLA